LSSFRQGELTPGELPTDIDFMKVTVSVLLLPVGWAFVTPFIILIATVKFFPTLAAMFYRYWGAGYDSVFHPKRFWRCAFLPFFLAGNAFIPVVAILCLAVLCIHAVVVGVGLAFYYYKSNLLLGSLQYIPAVVRYYDMATTRDFKRVFNVCDPYGGAAPFSCFNYCMSGGFSDPALKRIVEDVVGFRIE